MRRAQVHGQARSQVYDSVRASVATEGAVAVPVVVPTAGLLLDWDATFSTLTTVDDGGGRVGVTQVNDRVANAHLVKTTATVNPLLVTDSDGRQSIRLNAGAWMAFTTAVNINYRSVCTIYVGKPHRMPAGGSAVIDMVSFYQHTLGSHMNIAMSGGYPWVRVVTGVTTTSTPVAPATRGMVAAGSQRQIIVTRANGTQIKLWVNENATVPAGAAQNASQTVPGGEVGRYATTPAGLGGFDIEKVLIYTSNFSDTDITGTVPGDPLNGGIIGKLMAYYDIAPITTTIELGADSLTFGYSWPSGDYGNTGLIPSGDAFPTRLAVNAASNNVRFISTAITGNRISDAVSRRDSAGGGFGTGYVATWNTMVHLLVGTNDQNQASASGSPPWTNAPSTAARGDEVIDRLIALINTPTTGYLQRGAAKVYVATCIAREAAADMAAIDQMRARLMDTTTFLTACDAHAGGTYPGKVVVEPLHLWQSGGVEIFNLRAAASVGANYAGDNLHLTALSTNQRSLSTITTTGL